MKYVFKYFLKRGKWEGFSQKKLVFAQSFNLLLLGVQTAQPEVSYFRHNHAMSQSIMREKLRQKY